MNTSFDELKLLITEAIEGSITAERMAKLNDILSSSRQARRFYFDFIDIQILTEHLCSETLFFHEGPAAGGNDTSRHDLLLQALAIEEKQADTIVIEPSRPPHEMVHPAVEYHKLPRQISKRSIALAIMSAAAMLLLFLFGQFGPYKMGYEVATLSDSINVQWADNASMPPGTRIETSYTPLFLKQGIVEFVFDNNTEVVIEAPAEFQVVSGDRIKLAYGRVYANVPTEAIGFTVSSQKTTVVDLGTEFGMYSDLNGNVELHVLQGKTLLLASDKSGSSGVEVPAGSAKKITSQQSVSDIPCDRRTFVRGIDSRRNVIWRGQKFLDLTDMIIGGDGQTAGQGRSKIDVLTGKRTGLLFVSQTIQNPGFQKAEGNPFVDGVFIPDRGDGEIVSSTGLRFEQCPDTTGIAFYHISTLREMPSIDGTTFYPLALSENPGTLPDVLLLHPNAGITYDLAAIRASYPDYEITGFSSSYGFPPCLYKNRATAAPGELILAPESATADFYVLLDGRICTKVSFNIGMTPQTLQIPISAGHRFLTLVSTDNNQNTNFDWMVLENPKLILEE